MIDLHIHLLHGVDDGPPDLATAVEMARACAADGVSRAVVTPHAYARVYHVDADQVAAGLAVLRQALREAGVALLLLPGSEVRLHARLLLHWQAGEVIGLGGGKDARHLLLELPARECPDEVWDTIYECKLRGVTCLLAHPERNLALQRKPDLAARLVEEGAILQLTAGSILGQWGTVCEKRCREWLSAGLPSVIASDAHDARVRAPGLSGAFVRVRETWRLHDAADACERAAESVWSQAVAAAEGG